MFKKLFATPQHGMSDEDYGNLMRYQTNFITVLFITLSICLFAGAFATKLMSIINLSNPQELHRRKIKDTDERVQQVRQWADALTLKILLIVAYLFFILGLSYFTQYFWYFAAPLILILIIQPFLRWLFTKLL